MNKFTENSANEFHKSLENLKNRGIESLILDLRNNSGGVVTSAIGVADEFLKNKQLIFFTKNHNGKKDSIFATNKGIFEDNRLYILINSSTASASEILAGAIQDQDAGTIIGRRSYGKGLIQNEINLGDGSKVRLTIARYYTPTGRCIQKPYKNNNNYSNELYQRTVNGELFNQDSIKNLKKQKFLTPKGKTVYGGGGITPDIFIPIDTLSTEYQLYKHNYSKQIQIEIFNLINKKREILTNMKEDNFIKNFHTEHFSRQILKKLKIKDINFTQFNLIVKSIMADFLFGKDAYTQIKNLTDPMILKAEALDETK